jgi:hypothetical protein
MIAHPSTAFNAHSDAPCWQSFVVVALSTKQSAGGESTPHVVAQQYMSCSFS